METLKVLFKIVFFILKVIWKIVSSVVLFLIYLIVFLSKDRTEGQAVGSRASTLSRNHKRKSKGKCVIIRSQGYQQKYHINDYGEVFEE